MRVDSNRMSTMTFSNARDFFKMCMSVHNETALLHRELRNFNLGQALAVFRTLFVITQLLCHVSALLTSACKQT